MFFTADTHFGHAGARSLYRRPFPDVAAMDAAMIANWNAVVQNTDEVWHLGDFAVRQTPSRVADLLAALHGRKHLLRGNNDDAAVLQAPGWDSIGDYAERDLDGARLVLCHYAFRTWRGMAKGWFNLHGHSHGRLKPLPRQRDVGVDAWHFTPRLLSEVLAERSKSQATKLPPQA